MCGVPHRQELHCSHSPLPGQLVSMIEDDILVLVQRPLFLSLSRVSVQPEIAVVALSMPSANHAPSQTQGDHKGVIFQSRPVRLLLGRPSRSSRERRETSEGVSPASSRAALWGGHNCGLYNMGYCWCWLVTLDEAFKEFSLSCLVSIKILQWRVKAWLPDGWASVRRS